MSKDDENLSVQPSLSPAAAAAGLGAEMARTSKCKTFLHIAMQNLPTHCNAMQELPTHFNAL